jgi:hypothetical protein
LICGDSISRTDEVEGKEQHQVTISKRFAALENLSYDVDTNRAGRGRGINLSRVTKLLLTWHRMQMVICLQIPTTF